MTAPVTGAPDADANHVATGEHMQSCSANLTRGGAAKHKQRSIYNFTHIDGLVCHFMMTQVVKNDELPEPGVAQDERVFCSKRHDNCEACRF